MNVVTNRFGPAQHLGVAPGRRRYPRRLQRERSGRGPLARGEEKASDPRRSGVKIDESRRDLVHHRRPQGRGELRRQPGGRDRIGKSVPAGLDPDHSGAERLLKQLTSIGRIVTGGRGELKPIETISELRDPLESPGHPAGQVGRRVPVYLWPMSLGQLGDLEARPSPCVWPLSDDDGQPVPAGQPGHVLNQEQGFAMSEMEIVEQEHRARLLRRDDEELAHRDEPALTCRGQSPGEGSLEFGPASGRDRIKQSGGCTGHLLENLGDTQVRTGAGRGRCGQPDGQRLEPGGLCRLVDSLVFPDPGPPLILIAAPVPAATSLTARSTWCAGALVPLGRISDGEAGRVHRPRTGSRGRRSS